MIGQKSELIDSSVVLVYMLPKSQSGARLDGKPRAQMCPEVAFREGSTAPYRRDFGASPCREEERECVRAELSGVLKSVTFTKQKKNAKSKDDGKIRTLESSFVRGTDTCYGRGAPFCF